ncbi:MAG TPA: sensor domain-containing protein [Holophagaceae bacterium]|nr:sensor domain-containing protein [Holophagaceae bacterium]
MSDATIDAYLDRLKAALKGCDKALIQDALWDAEDHLRSELARRRFQEPGLDQAKALADILAAFGEPDEVAAAYRDRDALVSAALAPARPSRASEEETVEAPTPRRGFFGIFLDLRAYTSLLYLLLSLATGIFFFTWAVTGISLSVGLAVLVIGIPFLIVFLGSVRLLALAEGRLVEGLLGVRMPRRQPPAESERGWKARLKGLFTDGRTWTSLTYLVLMLPLGIFYFTLVISLLSISLALLAAPVVHFVFHEVTFQGWVWGEDHTGVMVVIAGLLGVLAVPATLHLARLLGRAQGHLARRLLVRI